MSAHAAVFRCTPDGVAGRCSGLRQIDYQLVGWGWMLWDLTVGARASADAIPSANLETRIRRQAINAMHDER
jgi:hypothetical protein